MLDGDAAFSTLKSEIFAEMIYSSTEQIHLTLKQTAGYVDRAIAGEELQVVKDHLIDCEQCEMTVNDLLAFREQVAAGLSRAYQPSLLLAEPRWRRFVAPLYIFLPRPGALVFGSALTALLLILAGSLIWYVLQRKEAKIDETPSSSLTAGVAPIVSPTPLPVDRPAMILSRLIDGGGQVTLDQKGNISGIDNLTHAYLRLIKRALADQQLKKPPLLAGLTRPGSSPIRGRENLEGNFSTIKPVGTVILSDRPTFRWSRLNGAASYVVEVYDDKFARVAVSSQLIDNWWKVPEPLPRGKIYLWQVKAIKDGKDFISPRLNEAEAKFRILDQARADELMEARRIYARSHLMLGVLYARDGLLDEAELEMRTLRRANPKSAIARRLLANVHAMR
jgi:hypothetical protein